VLLVSVGQDLLGLSGLVLFQVMFDDVLELLHIEEQVIVPVQHGLVPLHRTLLVIAVVQGMGSVVHGTAEGLASAQN
jgi:hypothetical protein